MRRLRKLLRLPADERQLILEAAFALEMIKLGLRLLPFQTLRRLLDRAAARMRREDGVSAGGVARAVDLVSRRTPGAKTCLTRALALRLLLARRGHPVTLHIGVVREGKEQLQAHAWVESGGKVVIGGQQLERYTPLMALGGDGT